MIRWAPKLCVTPTQKDFSLSVAQEEHKTMSQSNSMTMSFLARRLFLLAVAVAAAAASPPSVYPVDEYFFDATIDHFNFRPTTVPTFPLRYYVNEQHWNGSAVFFYAGNEADIFQFVNNSGFLFEAAQDFGAMVVFAEHRYYGRSMPFGEEYAMGTPYNVSFLTVEQAMEDFNTLSVFMRKTWSMMSPETAFIVFGGSYGANLAMWLRLKNPNLWAGAIASSATPLKHLLRETNAFTRIETEAYGNVSSSCPDLVRQGWKDLYKGASTGTGRTKVAQELGLCHPLVDEEAADDIHGWISGALETMVQYGYPYESGVYNTVPGYPFRVACQGMLASNTSLGALKAAAKVYYNYTGQAGACFDFDEIIQEAAVHWQRKGQRDRLFQQHVRSQKRAPQGLAASTSLRTTRLGERAARQSVWDIASFDKLPRLFQLANREEKLSWYKDPWGYQTCTEVYQPMPTDGITDFEVPYTPNQTEYFLDCQRQWGVEPRPNWEEMTFMGADIGAGSNIFLTNGQVDPWRAAGIQTVPKGSDGSIIVRTMENAAHHLDLRASHELDPPSVTAVREEEKVAIREWIAQWRLIHS
jgi:hypothetical protein